MTTAIPAGAALDREVAEKVMGWVPWMEDRGGYTHVVWMRDGFSKPWAGTQRAGQQPERYKQITSADINSQKHIEHFDSRFSTSWEGCGLVVERMRELGWEVTLDTLGTLPDVPNPYAATFIRWHVEWPDGEGEAPTAPEAVCRAALAALA